MNNSLIKIPAERIERAIYQIRGERVILDSDLAAIYGVTTKRLNEQVKRNKKRFPGDFVFQLTENEFEAMRSQFATSNNEDSLRSQTATSKPSRGGRRYLPNVFTEHGAIMAANILNSDIAIEASVEVVRAFVRLRRMVASSAELSRKLETLEKKYDTQFKIVFDAIRNLMLPPDKPKGEIGFVSKKKK